MSYEELARKVSRQLSRDNARKARILQRSPHLAYSMDAAEIEAASGRELASRELKELGIDAGENDPIAILDAHHSGRKYARDRNAATNNSSAYDAREACAGTFMAEYLNLKE